MLDTPPASPTTINPLPATVLAAIESVKSVFEETKHLLTRSQSTTMRREIWETSQTLVDNYDSLVQFYSSMAPHGRLARDEWLTTTFDFEKFIIGCSIHCALVDFASVFDDSPRQTNHIKFKYLYNEYADHTFLSPLYYEPITKSGERFLLWLNECNNVYNFDSMDCVSISDMAISLSRGTTSLCCAECPFVCEVLR